MYCHPERSEGSRSQILRFAQNDTCVKVILSKALRDDIWPTVIALREDTLAIFIASPNGEVRVRKIRAMADEIQGVQYSYTQVLFEAINKHGSREVTEGLPWPPRRKEN